MEVFVGLIQQMLQWEPASRPSTSELLSLIGLRNSPVLDSIDIDFLASTSSSPSLAAMNAV
jgi:hypothetical protein